MLGIFVAAFVTALSGALMPGPVLTITIAEAAKRGARAGPLVVLGHAVPELALVCVLAAGLGRFLQKPAVFGGIGLAGGAALVLMAISMIRAPAVLPTVEATATGATTSALRPAGLGAGASLANPYWSFWWATVGLTILSRALPYGAAGVAVFFAGHILADFAWYALIAVGVSLGRRLLTQRAYRALIVVCAVALAVLGGYFIWSGGERLGVL